MSIFRLSSLASVLTATALIGCTVSTEPEQDTYDDGQREQAADPEDLQEQCEDEFDRCVADCQGHGDCGEHECEIAFDECLTNPVGGSGTGSSGTEPADAPCPWTITGIAAERWANGNYKLALRAKGSFPIPWGVSERPIWYVNGVNVGHSDLFFDMRTVYGSTYLMDDAQNTVKVQFNWHPHNGASHSYTFYYDKDLVPPGGQTWF